MRKRATEGTKISTSLSMTKNTVSTRSRAERPRISIFRARIADGSLLRSTGHGGELLLVRRHLLGVIVAVASVDKLVPLERRGMQLPFGGRNRVEMPVAFPPSPQRATHPPGAGEPAMRRDIADAEPDPPVIRP